MSAVIQPLDDIMVIMEEPYMRKKTVGKIATGLIVLALVLSGLMVLQFGARADERQEGRVEGILSIEDATIPRGLEVNLIDLYENEVYSTETSRGGYFRFEDVDAGYYRVEFPTQSYKEQHVYFRSRSIIHEVEKDTTTEFDLEVERKPLDYTINGTVLDQYGEVVDGTEITVEDLNSDYSNTVGLYNETSGEYRVNVYESSFTITATAVDYPEIMHEVVVDDDVTLNITLTDEPNTPLVTGYLWSVDGGVNTELRVTLYHEDMGVFHETIDEGPYFEIAAPRGGIYTLVIDSDGYLPYIREELDVAGDEVTRIGTTEAVDTSEVEHIQTTMEFETGWETLDITRERSYQPDTMIQGIDYSNIGLLALQIDLAYGNGDLELDYSELQAFTEEHLQYVEANIPSSHRLIQVDGVSYRLVDHDIEMYFPGLESSGDSISVFEFVEGIESISTLTYESIEEIEVEDLHNVDLYLQQDYVLGNYRDYSFEIDLPEGYERTNIPTNVDVSGFTTVTLDTHEGVGRTHVSLVAQLSEPGEVDIILEEGPNVYLKEIEEDDEILSHYIVKVDTNVSCTADFVDPVGSEEDAGYTWYLDGVEIGTGDEIYHTFTDIGERTLEVEVLETGGHVTTDEVTVYVDGEAPQGEIEGVFVVDEGEEFTLSAYNFTDDSGEIGYYQWNFTDGSDPVEGSELYNVTHTYELHGTYDVKLNITDVVGNYEIYVEEIVVNDVTPPVPLYNLTYQKEEETVTIHSDDLAGDRIERIYPITLDASESYDPAGFDGEIGEVATYTWWIEEDAYEHEGMILEDYQFDSVGEYSISLNVTDEHGNYENITRSVRITLGPTPDLELSNLRVTGEKRVNEELTVSVNVTNWGDRIAENINLEFSVDGEDIPITDMTFEKDGEETNNTIDTNEMKTISFMWTPEDDGEMSLNVTVFDSEEPEELRVDNTLLLDINIEPPAWRRYIVYALVPIVIIGVTVGLYFYKEKYQ